VPVVFMQLSIFCCVSSSSISLKALSIFLTESLPFRRASRSLI
jgi:hypothetical protein